MSSHFMFAFWGNVNAFLWIDIAILILAIYFAALGVVRGISGSISRLFAYITTFSVGMYVYNLLRGGWFSGSSYYSQLGAFVIAFLIGLGLGICVGLLIAKCLRIIVVQPFDSILGVFSALLCYMFLLVSILFLLKLTPVNMQNFRENTISGMVGYAILDEMFLEESM